MTNESLLIFGSKSTPFCLSAKDAKSLFAQNSIYFSSFCCIYSHLGNM
ncbi:MAG: DUF295 domain-containing protein [Alloprevotella sp.]|nr:MAG: DUF295 domain-containing protein [Alloprevotella sp.]